MTLDQLRVFAVVAELEHITRAAENLAMAQSAVSGAIAALEREYGTKLFHRVGRRIALTEGGRLLLEEARGILGRVAAADFAMREFTGLARGRLAIKASQTIANHFLPPRLVSFHERYPGVSLAIAVGNSAEVARAILDGDVELGFVEGPEGPSPDPQLATEPVAEDPLVMVVAPGHPWSAKAKLSPEDLAATRWVVREDGSGTRAFLAKTLAELGVSYDRLNVVVELPSNEAVLAAVLAGAGATVLSERVCCDALDAERLVRLPIALSPRAFYAIQHVDRYRSRAVAAFLEVLRTGTRS